MRARSIITTGLSVALLGVGITGTASASGERHDSRPTLAARAVLPVATYSDGPPSGSFFAGTTTNGISFPLASQPVEGFSAIIDGRHRGDLLAMPDNGFGTKANSRDFLIRAYDITPRYKTATGGTGEVIVGDHIDFRDPNHVIGFPIVNDTTTDRLLTGGDIDPESLQRDRHGDYWVGDEFGPWILHFDPTGILLDPPYAIAGLMSPNNPFLGTSAPTQPNSRGFEAMAISDDGQRLVAALEGATVAETGTTLRRIFEFDIRHQRFTNRQWTYQTAAPANMLADMTALDDHHFAIIERDGGLGTTALFRTVTEITLPRAGGRATQQPLIDLTAIADPNLISLPATHPGDIGLGDPFHVVCESVEAIHRLDHHRILIGCDNNFPNKGRNPDLADDTELIVINATS